MEHRWGKRFPLHEAVKLRLRTGAVVAGGIANASLSGAFVQTTSRLPINTYVLLELDSDGAQQSGPECIPAYVVRAVPDGVGLEWSEFAPPAVVARLPSRRRSRTNLGAIEVSPSDARSLLLRHLDDGARYGLDPYEPVVNAFHARGILGDDPQADTFAVVGNDSP
jgi:hypothetical protein